MQPLIGLTVYHHTDNNGVLRQSLPEDYLSAVAAAGGLPVLLPLGVPEATLGTLLERLDGVLFTGGGDIHPKHYGMALDDHCQSVDEERDRLELYLLDHVIQMQRPFLGICRGMQLINVGLGGSLYTDLPSQRPSPINHALRVSEGYGLAHTVKTRPNSQLAEIIGADDVWVNSRHHQGVRQLAPRLTATAYAADGLIEAFELTGYAGHFALAVQWHPENIQHLEPMRALFTAFVQASKMAKGLV